MTNEEKAKIILEHLEHYLQIDWNFEEYYIRAIKNGLNEIEKQNTKKA